MSLNAPLPDNEAARLKALYECRILDTPQDKAFDDLSRIAADICGTPIALITLVDTERQWFKSKVGADITASPLTTGFCPFVIQKGDSLIIPDTLADEQYATNPVVVSNPYIRFYAGVPLTTSLGHILGTICVIDYVPRELSPKQIEALQALSRQVMTQIELRHSLIELSRNSAELKQAQSELQKANDELELRVENRTVELRNALERLQSEIIERQRTEEILREDTECLSAIIATQYDIAVAELNLNKVMNLIVERTQNLTGASGAAIELVEGDEMVYHVTSGTVAAYVGLRLKIATSLSGHCVRTGEILRCNDAELDPRVDIVACRRVGARSMILVPLHHDCTVVGVLKVVSPQADTFGERDVQTLQLMAGLIGAAIRHTSEFEAKQVQINERQQAESALQLAHNELESRVSERTKELEVANVLLQAEIFERRQAEEALRHSEERYRSLILASTQITWTSSANGRMTGEQLSWSAFTGQTYEEYQNFGWSAAIHPDDVEHTLASWNRAVSTQSLCEMEHRLRRHDGEYRYFSVRAAPVLNADGSIREWVGAHTDITERKQAEEALRESEKRLAWQSRHDVLTGLVNRWEFEQRLEQALTSAKTHNQQHSLCFLDLDQFKIVNDTCGHAAGDELLRQVTALLQKQVRATDTLARLGGDEFGLLLNKCPLIQSMRIANALRQSLQEFRFGWQDKTFTIGVSIGLVAIDADALNLSSVLSAADAACYAAKNAGRNRVHLYEADDQELAIGHGQMRWISRLTKALQDNSFCLYYQPIVPLAQAQSKGEHYEILLRLQDETGKLVPPMAFIPAAERYNLMHIIDRWVISTFFASLSQHYQEAWQCCKEPGCSSMYTINLSGASINDDSFVDFLDQQFTLYSVPPQVICFEITETLAITNLSKAGNLIRQLKHIGCSFALDDFGSGMSSFAYLKNLPVDYLKIDGEFIKDIVDDPTDLALTKAINQVGHAMGIQTIAEFVENDSILEKITALGVDYAQGYGIAKPQPLQFNS